MSNQVLNQNLEDRAPDQQMLMAQLLFREKPKSAGEDALKSALEANLGEIQVVGGKTSDGPAMFAVQKLKAVFEDVPQGIPVLACIMEPTEFSSQNIDELQRTQFWDFPDGAQKIDEFKFCVNIFNFYGSALHYQEQAELLLAQVDAALKCYPGCEGIYIIGSGKLTTPEDFEDSKRFDLAGRFIRLAVNARFFTIQGTEDDAIVDTIGFHMFHEADVQLHFRGINPNFAVSYVYNLASYQFSNGFPIAAGDTVDSMDENGNMQWEPQWRTQYEESLVQPVRVVLDVNCGEFAAGTRD